MRQFDLKEIRQIIDTLKPKKIFDEVLQIFK